MHFIVTLCLTFASICTLSYAEQHYYHKDIRTLTNGANATMRAMAFKAWKNVGPMENPSNIIETITTLSTTIGSATICGKICLKTSNCCGFYYKHQEFCKLVNTSRRNETSVVKNGVHYYELVSQCTKNKSICGDSGECVPHFHNNSFSCIYKKLNHTIVAFGAALVWEFKGDGRCLKLVNDNIQVLYYGSGQKRHSAFLFQNIDIEKGAFIKSAKIEVITNIDNRILNYDIIISAMKTNPYHATTEDVSDNTCAFRNSLTDSHAVWAAPHAASNSGSLLQTPDLKEIIQEIVNLDDWQPGDGIIIVFHNDNIPDYVSNASGKRYYYRWQTTDQVLHIRI